MKLDAKKLIPCLGWFTICYSMALVGYLGCERGLWYWWITLIRPTWDPPVWTVTPISMVLYGLNGFAAWLIWQSERSTARTVALVLTCMQLALAASWPWVLFAGQKLVPGIIELIVLWLVTLTAAIMYWRIQPKAGGLLMPGLASTLGVIVLDVVVWKLNRS